MTKATTPLTPRNVIGNCRRVETLTLKEACAALVAMLSGAGLATCLTFLWFSAPDLALTQLVVEAATAVLFLLGLRWLPKRGDPADARSTRGARVRSVRDLFVEAFE